MQTLIRINNAADISVIVIYFLVVLAVGLWVGWAFFFSFFVLDQQVVYRVLGKCLSEWQMCNCIKILVLN